MLLHEFVVSFELIVFLAVEHFVKQPKAAGNEKVVPFVAPSALLMNRARAPPMTTPKSIVQIAAHQTDSVTHLGYFLQSSVR
jgi:hypothetical protein